MTSRIQGPAVHPEGTCLPPPRPFGDANTLTLPRRRRNAPGQGSVVQVSMAAQEESAVQRAAIMRAEAAPLTVTF